MQVVFRVDAASFMGTGHVMRCATLADALQRGGADVRFVCRSHPGNLVEALRDRGFPVVSLPLNSDAPTPIAGEYATWIGASLADDAEQTVAALAGGQPNWLIVDHYGLDERWEGGMRPHVGKIAVIDDLADRHHDCELLLDQNLVAGLETRYDGKVPPGCRLLLGPVYSMLDRAYAELHGKVSERSGRISRVLISFGGADGPNLTARFLAAILRVAEPDVEVDVVVSVGSPHLNSLREQAAGNPRVRLHQNLPTLAPLMASADIAIGGSGATTWERLCLRLYALVVTLADNQRPVAEEMHRMKLIRWLGDAEEVNDAVILSAMKETMAAPIPRIDTGVGQQVDGRGTERVSEDLLALTAPADL